MYCTYYIQHNIYNNILINNTISYKHYIPHYNIIVVYVCFFHYFINLHIIKLTSFLYFGIKIHYKRKRRNKYYDLFDIFLLKDQEF
jgi:hypothetical protein